MDKFCSAPETTRYTYDNNGNITGIYSKVGSGEETTVATYEYDELNQLVKENDKTYVYDNFGNILSAGNNTYSYSTGEWKDQLTTFNGQSITYDELGNPTNYLGASLSWKNGRQLARYSKGALSVNYEYNQEGLRVEKVVNGITYKYIWVGNNLVHQSWNNNYIHFYYDIFGRIESFEYFDGQTTLEYFYIKNIQGDIVSILNTDGETVAKYTYDAWGNVLAETGELATINPIRYRGYYYDDEIDMYYLHSRYYDPIIAKFINSDSANYITYTGSLLSTNLFAYCENSCVVLVDASGYSPTVMEAARMASNIYKYKKNKKDKALSCGWVFGYYISGGNGMIMGVYYKDKNGKREYALVNKGTSDLINWVDNITQVFGKSKDMTASLNAAKKFVENHKKSDITMIGHSKGGAEAAANAVATNKKCIIFNPASVNLKALDLDINDYTKTMTAYIVKGEILNLLFGAISTPIDKAVYLPNKYSNKWYYGAVLRINTAIKNHKMDAVIWGLKEKGYK